MPSRWAAASGASKKQSAAVYTKLLAAPLFRQRYTYSPSPTKLYHSSLSCVVVPLCAGTGPSVLPLNSRRMSSVSVMNWPGPMLPLFR